MLKEILEDIKKLYLVSKYFRKKYLGYLEAKKEYEKLEKKIWC